MDEAVLKCLIARIEESAIFYNKYKNETWLEQLERDRVALIKFCRKLEKENQ